MRRHRAQLTRVFLAILPLLAVSASLASDAAPSWTPEQQAVIDAASRGPIGIERDFEAWQRGYHPDWSYWRLGAEETRPRAEHMKLVRDYIGQGHRVAGFELEPVDVVVRGEVALLRYNATERIEEADGGERVVRFSSAALYFKENGAWICRATNIFYPPEGD